MHLTGKQKKLLRWFGYPLLAIVVFVFALAYTFPYERLKGKIIESMSDKYDVTIVSIEPSLIPGTFTIHNMVLVGRPTTVDEKPMVVVIDEIEVNVGVFSAIFWSMDLAEIGVEIEAKMGGGVLEIEVDHSKGDNTLSVNAHVQDMPMDTLPGVAEAVGLPMTGSLTAGFQVTLPRGKWSKAEGEIKWNCLSCTVGDGVAQIKMKPPLKKKGSRKRRVRPMDENLRKLTVPKINLGVVEGRISIRKGKGKIEEFSAKSKDGHLDVTGEVNFKDPFKETLFPGCMKFGFSDELKEREPSFLGIQAALPPKSKLADGSYAIPTKGKLVDLRFDKRKQCVDEKSKGGSKKGKAVSARDKPRPRVMPVLDKPEKKDTDKEEKKGDEAVKKEDDSPPKGKTDSSNDVRSGPKLGKKAAKIDEEDKEPSADDDDDDDDDDEGDDDDDDDNGGEGDEEVDEGAGDEPLEDE